MPFLIYNVKFLKFTAIEDYDKKHTTFVSHNERMEEIKKLSGHATFHLASGNSVKDEITRLSAKWDYLDDKFKSTHDVILQKRSSLQEKDVVMPSESTASTQYLESLPEMENKLKDFDETNMAQTKLTELISDFKSFNDVKVSLEAWIKKVQLKIDSAEQQIARMESDKVLEEHRNILENLLQVYFILLISFIVHYLKF